MEKKSFDIKKLTSSREASLATVLIILCALIAFRNNTFITPKNLNNMFVNYAIYMILALGMMCVLVIGEIDISIGSTIALSGMSGALVLRDHQGTPTIVVFLIAILVGTLCGVVIGLVIAKGKVISIIATLGFMNIFRGATYLLAKNQWVAAYQVTESFKGFATGKYLTFGLMNNMIVVAIVCYIVFFYFLKYTRTGRKVYAVGSNAEAAEVSGINIDSVRVMIFGIMGMLCGLSGALWVSTYASAQGDMASGIEMDIIAACVIGGVSLTGGRGSVLGVLLGALTIAVLGNGLPLIGVSQFWLDAIKGLIIIVAVILNVVLQRSKDKQNLKRREI
ncbi:MAG: ABC transporter permease [Lachnotalea sp.]